MQDRKRKGLMLLWTGAVLLSAAWFLAGLGASQAAAAPEWTEQVIRLHVVANSDSPEDQAVKRAVRDAVMDEVTPVFVGAATLKEAEEAIRKAEPQIREVAARVLADHGVAYGVQLEMGRFAFPDRAYGRVLLPAGEYNALRVTLGESNGANWWCVLFPPLCFTDWTAGVVLEPKPGTGGRETVPVHRRQLKALVDEDAAEQIPVRGRSVVLDWLKGQRKPIPQGSDN